MGIMKNQYYLDPFRSRDEEFEKCDCRLGKYSYACKKRASC